MKRIILFVLAFFVLASYSFAAENIVLFTNGIQSDAQIDGSGGNSLDQVSETDIDAVITASGSAFAVGPNASSEMTFWKWVYDDATAEDATHVYPNDTDGTGNWQPAPSIDGDMLKSVYDANDDGEIDDGAIPSTIARDSELHDAVTLDASATTGGMSLSGQAISNRAASNSQTGYATAAHIQAIEANTAKTIDDTAYNEASWNANTDAPTKNAVRDKFESLGTGGDMTEAEYATNGTAGVVDKAAELYPVKSSGVPGHVYLLEANSTDVDFAGGIGPASMTDNTSYVFRYPNAGPTLANSVLAWNGAGESGTGTPADPFIFPTSFIVPTVAADWDTWAEHPAMTSAYILVGNGSNQPAPVAVSGDVHIDNTGATVIQPAVVAPSMLDTSADDDAIEFVIDGGGTAITTGVKGFLEIPYACTISRVTLLADQSTSTVVDLWVDSYANYPPDNDDSITDAGTSPTITAATKSQDSTLTSWTTSLTKGQIIGFNVDSNDNAERLTISIGVDK